MIDILLIAIICVIIIDLSGITDSIKSALKRIVTKGRMSDPNYSLKPIDCSFCITFWTGLIYMLITHSLTLWMTAYLLCICVMTPVIKDILILIKETLLKIIRYLS